MNWVDLVVIALAILAAVSGARQGVITALPAFIGVLLGAIAGIKIAPLVVKYIESTPTRVAFAVAIFVLLVALGETLGVWLGRSLRERIKSPKLAGVDNALGAIVQGAVVFVVAWLIALPLVTVGGLPDLASAIRNSTMLGGVDKVMPQAAQDLPDELRKLLDVSGFPEVVDPFDRTPNREVAPPGPGAAEQRGRAERAAEHPEDPRAGAVLLAGAGGQRVRDRAGADDDQRARRGRHDRGRRRDRRRRAGRAGRAVRPGDRRRRAGRAGPDRAGAAVRGPARGAPARTGSCSATRSTARTGRRRPGSATRSR